MNTQHSTIRTGIAAITGALILAAPFGVDAANRPAPEVNKRPKPSVIADASTWLPFPCPAADDIPVCDLVRPSDQRGATGRQTERQPNPAGDTPVGIDDRNDDGRPETVHPRVTDWVDDIGIGCRRVPWPTIVACPE